jgi:hypothetical protein
VPAEDRLTVALVIRKGVQEVEVVVVDLAQFVAGSESPLLSRRQTRDALAVEIPSREGIGCIEKRRRIQAVLPSGAALVERNGMHVEHPAIASSARYGRAASLRSR